MFFLDFIIPFCVSFIVTFLMCNFKYMYIPKRKVKKKIHELIKDIYLCEHTNTERILLCAKLEVCEELYGNINIYDEMDKVFKKYEYKVDMPKEVSK